MKHFTWLIVLFALKLNAQTTLKFDTRFLESENKWIALPMSKDSTFTYGFVYLDNVAGLTFHLGGTFKVLNDGKFIGAKQPVINVMKQRLSPSNIKIAIIPSSKFNELQIEEVPEWLKLYQTDDNNIMRLFKLGYTYNAWNEPTKALSYLEKVKAMDPKYRGLDYELAFAYNVLKQYDKTIAILTEALEINPKNCNLYKEMAYAQMNLKLVDKAIESCKKALEYCSDKNVKSEMLYNITYYYFKQKDKEQFKYWATEAKKVVGTDSNTLRVIAKMETEINN